MRDIGRAREEVGCVAEGLVECWESLGRVVEDFEVLESRLEEEMEEGRRLRVEREGLLRRNRELEERLREVSKEVEEARDWVERGKEMEKELNKFKYIIKQDKYKKLKVV